MDELTRLYNSGIVPVVVIENAADAVPAAHALLAGGIDVMEITFRTAAAADSIAAVAKEVPEMLVGAGTVVTLEQCKKAVEAGAKFIVSPGYDEEVVSWCCDNGVAITPGCVTPTEIMMALKHNIKVIKFFPANVYGGLTALKALAGPFTGITFIPTGGVNTQNIGEYAVSPYVHAVGGSWICPKADISAHNWDKITTLCKEARNALLGYEIAHIGINASDSDAAMNVCTEMNKAFDFATKEGNSSNFASPFIEVMKSPYLGTHGHLAVRTNRIKLAINDIEKKGYLADPETTKFKGDKMVAIYLKDEIGGFALHLLQK